MSNGKDGRTTACAQRAREPGTTGAGTAGRQRRRQARVGTHHPPAVCTDSRVGDGVNERPGYIVKPARGFELFFFWDFTGLPCVHRRTHRSRSTPSIHGDELPAFGTDVQSASAASGHTRKGWNPGQMRSTNHNQQGDYVAHRSHSAGPKRLWRS